VYSKFLNFKRILDLVIIYGAKKNPLAFQYYDNALSINPSSNDALYAKAKLFQDLEKNRLAIKILSKNLFISKDIRMNIQEDLDNFKQNSSLTRIKNICVLTGRSRSVYRFFKISRLQLRKLASTGYLPGVSKFSW
jgi:small subunit ribosomal protein S14